MKMSNTSLMFKGIAQAVPLSENKLNTINGKERKVEIWDEVLFERDSGEKTRCCFMKNC